jgi:hypothetical protein
LYQLLVPFVESQVNYNDRVTATAWSSPGANGSGTDRSASSIGSGITLTTNGSYIAITGAGLTDYVQDVIDGAISNYGFCIFSDGFAAFESSENTTDGYRPYLEIDITFGGGGGAPGNILLNSRALHRRRLVG